MWLQEQCARKLIPLVKVLGTANHADLMTKHLSHKVIQIHMKALNNRYVIGRAASAAQIQFISRATRRADAVRSINSMDSTFHFGAGGDSWNSRGEDCKWSRVHRVPRNSLFTPYSVSLGPGKRLKLEHDRVTTGVSESGFPFEIHDHWTNMDNAHRLCDEPWTGITTFVVRPRAAATNQRPNINRIQFRNYIRADGIKHNWWDFD